MIEKIFVDMETIRQLAEIVSEKNLGEITITDDKKTITVKGKKCATMPVGMPPIAVTSAPAETVAVTETASTTPVSTGNTVKAPIVGTFYAAPSPDQKPFVQVGDTVKKGDVLFIIESMKLMNEVQSDFNGMVKEILVQNGDCVEYDQPLMIIE